MEQRRPFALRFAERIIVRPRPARVLATLLLAPMGLWAGGFVAQGPALTVTSATATVSFQGPDVVSIVNLLTGESYLHAPAPVMLSNLLTSGTAGTFAAGSWLMNSSGTAATLTASDGIRSITITVTIDPQTQEIAASLSGQSSQSGVERLSWGITGFDMNAGTFILPALGGISLGSAALTAQSSYYFGVEDSYNHWDAPLMLYQTSQGGVAVYSTDTPSTTPQALYKNIVVADNQLSTANVFPGVAALAPWPQAVSAGPVQWRIAPYQGGWQQGAQIYRDWHNAAMPPAALTGARAWAAQIRAVVKIDYVSPYDSSVLDQLATEVNPAQTLLYLADWRNDAFDTNYPDYTPAPNTALLVQHAHALGFHVMLHASMIGVSPGNPDFQSVSQYQALDETGRQLLGFDWSLPASTPTRYAYIDPASSAYRSLLVSRLQTAIQSLGVDALHLNIAGWPANDGGGPIGGMNFAQGAVQLQRDLLSAFPGLVLGGEGTNDLIAPYASFEQQPPWPAGFNSNITPGVPITAYVFPNVMPYGHLGYPNPYEAGFLTYFTQYESQAVLATYSLGFAAADQLNYSNPDMLRQLNVTQAVQQYQMTPAWDADWNGAILQYSGAGAKMNLSSSGNLIQLQMEQGSQSTLLYQRAYNTNQLQTASSIPAWPAYSAGLIMGLDPEDQYWLESSPSGTAVEVTNLPAGIKLSTGLDTLVAQDFAYFKFLPTDDKSFDFFANLWLANMGISYNGSDSSMGYGAEEIPQTVSVGGVSGLSVFAQPPYLGGMAGGSTFLEYSVPVPDGYSAAVNFSVGVSDSDGLRTLPMTFQVFVNDVLAWENNVAPGAWAPGSVDLTLFLNQTVRIRFATGPGPSGNPAYAWGAWSGLQLSVIEKPAETNLAMAVPAGLAAGAFTLPGGTITINGGTASIESLPLGQPLLLFLTPPTAAAAGQTLFTLPFTASQSAPGQLAGPSQVAYAGATGPSTSGGVTKQTTLYGYPPANGQLILSWPLQLPAASSLSLGFSAGLSDGATPASQGVLLSVRVNGVVLWQYNANLPAQWQYGTVDLAPWAGQNVLVELISDSLGPNSQDWTSWAELTLTGSAAGSCVATLNTPASLTAPALGVTGSIQITTASGCQWSAAADADWLSITPASGAGSAVVTYTVQSNPGPQRSGGLSIAGNLMQITQQASPPPELNSGGIVRAADYGVPVAPGSLATLFGTNLAQSQFLASALPLPLALGGLTVTINGTLAPILYAGPNQINFQVPYDTPPGAASVAVSVRDVTSFSQTVAVTPAAPAIFCTGNNQAVAQNQDYSLNSPSQGATPGDYITIYFTGGGAVDNPVGAGDAAPLSPLSRFTQVASATIGGVNAPVLFAGLTPGFAGLGQISILVPNLAAGSYPLVIVQDGQASNAATISVAVSGNSAQVR